MQETFLQPTVVVMITVIAAEDKLLSTMAKLVKRLTLQSQLCTYRWHSVLNRSSSSICNNHVNNSNNDDRALFSGNR